MWVQSYADSSVLFLSLRAPNGTSTPTLYLEPGGIIDIHTFTSTDPLGTWTVSTTEASSGQAGSANVTLARPTLDLVPTLTEANLTYNNLQLSFSVPPSDGYNIQACAMGSGQNSSTTYQLPSDIGGSLGVILSGAAATVTTLPAYSRFSVWFELYSLRSYFEGNSLVSVNTLAAETGVINAGSIEEQQVAAFTDQLNLRAGRYELRTFVQGPSGLTTFDSQFLKLVSTTWVSLDGCSKLSSVISSSFTMTTNLENSTSSWPRSLVTMYDEGGVDGYNISRIPAQEARIDVVSATQKEKITGVTLSASGAGIRSWDPFDSSIYIIGAGFPFNVTVSIEYEGISSQHFDVALTSPFSTMALLVPVGTAVVQSTSQGSPLANATFTVVGDSQPSIHEPTFKTNDAGTYTLTLPPGTYNVTGTYEGRSATFAATVVEGGATSVKLDLGAQTIPYLLYLVAGLLAIGAALNFVFWRAYLERRDTYKQLSP